MLKHSMATSKVQAGQPRAPDVSSTRPVTTTSSLPVATVNMAHVVPISMQQRKSRRARQSPLWGSVRRWQTGGDGFAIVSSKSTPLKSSRALLARPLVEAASATALQAEVPAVSALITVRSGNAFHIEFDTWHNNFDGSQEHTDPLRDNGTGTGNHIAITTNGNPGMHYIWEEVSLEDNQWHQVEIKSRQQCPGSQDIQSSYKTMLWRFHV